MMRTEYQRRYPTQLDPVFARSLACEYASLTRDNRPVTWPVTPYVGAGGTLDVSTGLSYPDKAERARRNPRVALSFSDPTGTSIEEPATVLVQGRATVRDGDLQSNTDRYVEQSLARTEGMNGMPWFLLRRLDWYFARIWVEVTPERVLWWPRGDLSAAPQEWRAPAPVLTPPSDPAPHGGRLAGRGTPPTDWRPFAERAQHLGNPVVTMVVDGAPLPVRTRAVARTDDGFQVRLPRGIGAVTGPVCLTFHRLGGALKWQENVVLVGQADGSGELLDVRVERALSDWSLHGSQLQRIRSFLGPGKELRRRVEREAERRGQPVPVVSRPRR